MGAGCGSWEEKDGYLTCMIPKIPRGEGRKIGKILVINSDSNCDLMMYPFPALFMLLFVSTEAYTVHHVSSEILLLTEESFLTEDIK
jgi:hypothetical protein